jgi:hypothetical protein
MTTVCKIVNVANENPDAMIETVLIVADQAITISDSSSASPPDEDDGEETIPKASSDREAKEETTVGQRHYTFGEGVPTNAAVKHQ